MDGVTLDLVGQPDGRRLRDRMVADQGAFDFRGAQAVAGHFDDVVHPADDPEIPVLVSSRAESPVKVHAGKLLQYVWMYRSGSL